VRPPPPQQVPPRTYKGGFRGFLSTMNRISVMGQNMKQNDAVYNQASALAAQALIHHVGPISKINQAIVDHRAPALSLAQGFEYHRNIWRVERFKILDKTGAVGKDDKKVDVFIGFHMTVPGYEGTKFPLYPTSWYNLGYNLPYYDYESVYFNYKTSDAYGYKCGTRMDCNKPVVPTCSSCGSG